jgi:hypothetical protein
MTALSWLDARPMAPRRAQASPCAMGKTMTGLLYGLIESANYAGRIHSAENHQ